LSTTRPTFVPPNCRLLTSVGDRMLAKLLGTYLRYPSLEPGSRFRQFSSDEGAYGFHIFNGGGTLISGTQFYLHFNGSSKPSLWAVIRGRAVLLLTDDDDISDLNMEDLEVARQIREDLIGLTPTPIRS
jgi:hypothetical protein